MDSIKYYQGYKKFIEYYVNGHPHVEYHYDEFTNIHREDGPAIIEYYSNGNIYYEKYIIHGKTNRNNGPSIIYYYDNGNIKFEQYLVNNKFHREDGPACIGYYENGNIKYEHYFLNGYIHRDYELPAIKIFSENGNCKEAIGYINNTKTSKVFDLKYIFPHTEILFKQAF